jgi:hypothetical protein
MKTATALIVMAVGAVFAQRGYGWLRRQLVLHRGPDGRPVADFRRRNVPPYLMINPGPRERGRQVNCWPAGYVATAETAGAPGAAFDTAVVPAEAEVTQVIPDEEIVEEFFPE